MKEYSIKNLLIITVVAGSALVLLAAAVFLDIMLSFQMQKIFDQALLDEAKALEILVEEDQGVVEFEFADEIIPYFERAEDPHYFQIWLDGNRMFERSNSLGNSDLPRFHTPLHEHSFYDITLPDGRPGRLVEAEFYPRVDSGAEEAGEKQLQNTPGDGGQIRVTLLLARERVSLQQQRLANRAIIGVALLTTLLVIAALVKKFVSSGLSPLERLAAQVKHLDAVSLDRRITHGGAQSRELAPIEEQLNSLLERLESAFQREKRFSADVAHELRTPLAELRTLAEVGRQQPHDRTVVQKFFSDVESVSVQMTGMVNMLLELARSEAGQVKIHEENLELASFVDSTWADLQQGKPDYRPLTNRIPAGLRVHTDREMLRQIICNLLLNADDYSPRGSEIRVLAETVDQKVAIRVENSVIDLDETDILVMRDRFWRKDASRTCVEHSGLGLALVNVLTDVLGLRLELGLDHRNHFHAIVAGLKEA